MGEKRAKERGGRPTKFNHELAERSIQLVRAGNYMETASAAAGVHKETLYGWLREGARLGHGPKKEFLDAVERAKGEAEAANLALIGQAALKGQWQAAAWRLERMHSDRYAQRTKNEHMGADGEPLKVSISIVRKVGK